MLMRNTINIETQRHKGVKPLYLCASMLKIGRVGN